MPAQSESTSFSRDVIGRYVCNTLDEALRSADRSVRADARPFDIIIIGGGTFGAAIAQHLFARDKAHGHRILVLEGGPIFVPEHVQNLPMLGINPPGATSIAELRSQGGDGQARNEVWGLPWHSPAKFPGLAYCVGGRSLFWGGWSPQLLDAEMPLERWPPSVSGDLNDTYFRQASEQIGVTETNDFISGALHDALRKKLFDGHASITGAIPLGELPLHLDGVPAGQEAPFKLEAPLAVQTRTRSGFFPINKFSAFPLLMKATRAAQTESGGDDVRKRLMVVPNCHVRSLGLTTSSGPTKVSSQGVPLNLASRTVTSVETNLGSIPVPPGGAVIVALGTIESTRLALRSFRECPHANLFGQNLMAHLRSNLTIRIPREAIGVSAAIRELQASALFVKGRHRHADGTSSHFHLQITAAGLGSVETDSEAELFRKVSDIDGFDLIRSATDSHVVLTIRGIGEMEPGNPGNRVALDPELDEFGEPRAFVALSPTPRDQALWDAMDQAAMDVAKLLASPGQPEILGRNRDGLGTTHHEAGTLWMGTDPERSVTDPHGRFHDVNNAYVVGPALFPTIGSPNPMLTSIALARRLGDKLVPEVKPISDIDGAPAIFNGVTTDHWKMAGQGEFIVTDGALQSIPGNDLGLLWCTTPTPPNFLLALEWKRSRADDNSGVFVRFPDPTSKGYDNQAYVGVDFGFEVQIDDFGQTDAQRTGAIYNQAGQTLALRNSFPVDRWNLFEIRVQGQTYTVLLNKEPVAVFTNQDPARGLPGTPAAPSFIGLQSHTGRVSFRNIRVATLP